MVKHHGYVIAFLFVASLLVLGGCGSAGTSQGLPATLALTDTPQPTPEPVSGETAGLANPASVYCEEQGGRVELRDSDVGQYGVCIFAAGQECEEWALYRGECVIETGDASAAEVLPETQTDSSGSGPSEPIGLANPASVYCEEQGGRVELRDSDAGQYGVCIFADGQECEEWALYRGECVIGLVDNPNAELPEVQPEFPEPVPDPAMASRESTDGCIPPLLEVEWIGTISSMPADVQFDDYFQVMDRGDWSTGIGSNDDAINAQLVALRDTGDVVRVWGVLRADVPDAYGSHIEVKRLEVVSSGAEVEWIGTIVSTPADSQFDDYFQMRDHSGTRVGVDALDDAVRAQIDELRDSDVVVYALGVFHKDVPDFNTAQIQITRLRVASLETGDACVGAIVSIPDGEYDDYFQMMDQNGTRVGVDTSDDAVRKRLTDLRDTGATVHIWGTIHKGIPDVNGLQIEVTHLETE